MPHRESIASDVRCIVRLGMMVMNEAFDCWAEGKNPQDYHV